MARSSAARAVVVGGGFYGATIAVHLARRHDTAVTLLEAEDALLTRASFVNQARVHGGYHYPRSIVTGLRSRANLPDFVREWGDAVRGDFTKLYAIARRNSKTSAHQFLRFAAEIGAACEPAPDDLAGLFDDRAVEAAFVVEEQAFDAAVLREILEAQLTVAGVEVATGTRAEGWRARDGGVAVEVTSGGAPTTLSAEYAFNCTYSALAALTPELSSQLKHEIAEIALVRPPAELADLGITVMDGPFWSMMPFPARGLHSLSHVRYTPHTSWRDDPAIVPSDRLAAHPRESRVDRMMRDAARYVPAVADAEPVESLFDVKTILARNEADDGRPILFARDPGVPGAFAVLGGKIDNIYDVIERLDDELA